MNNRKFCFIICSNNEFLAEECQKYIRKLLVPEGYQTETIVIYDAESMTSGYNLAMRKSDAKYKIYLHQDVLLLNTGMLSEILDIFQNNPQIGMLGVVGNTTLTEDACPWSGEDESRIGELFGDLITRKVHTVFAKAEGRYQKVLTIDGMLMMTQYDIPWREELFKGWDFYDGSQSMEFWKAGYSVAVPYMKHPWCLHDNDILHLQDYEKWRRVFEREYRRYYQGRNACDLIEGDKLKENTPVIYQIFDPQKTRYSYPYPPVYQEKDTEYICFTDQKDITSKFWNIKFCERLSAEDIRKEMSKNPMSYEIKTDEIQIASAFCTYSTMNTTVKIPSFEEFPDISFNLDKFIPTRDKNGEYIYQKNPVYHGGKYDGRECVLTIGMPVSNQIETIDQCLSHIKPLLDGLDAELLIVDTGSTDGTIDVCRAYGARIIEFPWCDNMSAARNQGIYHAKGEWYLSIDDDEWFEDVSEILVFFQSGEYKKYDIAAYIQRNYVYRDEQVYTDSFALRMAKITPELHFEGRIHDALEFPDQCRGYQFHAYVHHYGFVVDNESRRKEKYVRNVSGLLYDLWETPEDLIYTHQLCKEFLAVGYYQYACAYCFLGISVEQEIDIPYYGHMIASSLMSSFYYAEDESVFEVKKMIEKRYSYTDAEKAYFAYILADIGTRKQRSPQEILQNITDYRRYKKAYKQNEAENQRFADVGVDLCSNVQYETDASIMAACAYERLGRLEQAIEELDKVQPEYVWYKKTLYIDRMLYGEREVYQMILSKMSVLQFELWISDIMKGFHQISDIRIWKETFARICEIVNYFSVQSLQVYMNTEKMTLTPEIEQQFVADIEQMDVEKLSLQQCYFFGMVVKQRMLKNQEKTEHMKRFNLYMKLICSFTEKYYQPALLLAMDNTAIPAEMKALYEIQKASNDRNMAESAMHLKNALKTFPGFKKEIQLLLDDLQQQEIKQQTAQREMELLEKQLKAQVQILIQRGKTQEAEQILRELEKIFPQGK